MLCRPVNRAHDRGLVGGHTAEMLALLRRMNPASYMPRQYVAAATDALGYTKARQTEQFFSSLHQVPFVLRTQTLLSSPAPDSRWVNCFWNF